MLKVKCLLLLLDIGFQQLNSPGPFSVVFYNVPNAKKVKIAGRSF